MQSPLIAGNYRRCQSSCKSQRPKQAHSTCSDNCSELLVFTRTENRKLWKADQALALAGSFSKLEELLTLFLLPLASNVPHLPPSLGPQSSGGLSTSFPTEARPGCPLLHMCQGPQTSLLVGSSVSGSSLGPGLVETDGLSMGLLSLSASSILPLNHPQLQGNCSASVSVSC